MTITEQARPANEVRLVSRARGVLGAVGASSLLLAILTVIVVFTFSALGNFALLNAPYDATYLADSLINFVPLALLGLAEMFVIVSGRGGIDLSVGAIVSFAGMAFGFTYGEWSWPLWAAIVIAVGAGAMCGLINGVLTVYLQLPALIATLGTYYVFESLSLVINNNHPISGGRISAFYTSASSVHLPWLGSALPAIPLGMFTFLLPTSVAAWLLLTRAVYGRQLFAVGTNDIAGTWAGVPVRRTRVLAYVLAGMIAGLVAIVTVGQFASARPDAGTSGVGMTLPAITIAVLGGVAITGGVARVSGVLLAALLITWLNAGLLLLFPGDLGSQTKLLALALVLILAALTNQFWRGRRRAA